MVIRLSENFLSPYKQAEPRNKGILYEVTILRYLRPIMDNGKYRLERPWEMCRRVVEYSINLDSSDRSESEKLADAEQMFDKMFHNESLPAGRTMRVGGTLAGEKNPESNFNCCFTEIEYLEDFCEAFHLSLCSCGVGFGITDEVVSRLPKVKTDFIVHHDSYTYVGYTNEATEHTCLYNTGPGEWAIQVGDSKGGWVQALRYFFNLVYEKDTIVKEITFNYDWVRPEGERLKTWGGRAAGHEGLKKMFDKLAKGICKSVGLFAPIDCLDINTVIGKNVVTGGSRRAAMIALFSPDNKECIEAKSGNKLGWFVDTRTGQEPDYSLYDKTKTENPRDWSKDVYEGVIDWHPNPETEHRTMSNNSIVFDKKPTKQELEKIFENIKYNGEPGFFNRESAKRRRPNVFGLNPCKPLSSLILTPKGYITFEDALRSNKSLKVVLPGGKVANASKPFKTGSNREVFKVNLSNGLHILGTDNHQHKLKSGEWKEIKDLNTGDELEYSLPLKASAEVHNFEEFRLGLITGWTYAEGSIGERSDSAGYSVQVSFGVNEFDCVSMMERLFGLETKPHGQKPETCKVIQTHRNSVAIEMIDTGYDYKDKSNLTWLLKKSKDFKLGFIKAVFTTDGSVRKNCVELYSEHREALVTLAFVLQEFGVYSGVSCHGKAKSYIAKDGKVRNNKDSWKLIVYGDQFKSIGFISAFKNSLAEQRLVRKFKLSNVHIKVKSIDLHSIEDVYDITVDDETHSFIDSGITTHNCAEILLNNKGVCNLSTTVLPAHLVEENGKIVIDFEKLEKSIRNAVRIGCRQTNVNLSLPKWDENLKRERLLGVSVTGWMDALDILGWKNLGEESKALLQLMNYIANDEADKYAFQMRIPRPLLVTCVKPEGSLSLLPTVSWGIHRSFAPYYIRRMKFASFDPICKALMRLGVPNEPDKTKKDSNRIVFSFPIATNSGIKAYDEPFREQFLRYLDFQKHYTDHNTSCTLYVGKDEWEEACDLVYEHWDDVIAVSFLSKQEGTYIQAPNESISKEEYERLSKDFPDLSTLFDLVDYFENGQHEDLEILDNACEGGICPIV